MVTPHVRAETLITRKKVAMCEGRRLFGHEYNQITTRIQNINGHTFIGAISATR
jgi:hypothetical protein